MTNQNIDLERNIFALGFSVVRSIWLPCAVAALLLLLANLGQGYLRAPLAFVALRALIIMIVAHSAYRVLVSGGRVSGWRAVGGQEGRIPWRFSGVMLMILAPMLILGIIWTAPGTDAGPSSVSQMALGVVMVIGYASAYVLLGTALPEVAERGNVSLAEAFERGRTNYRAIARALILGSWLFRAATMLMLISAGVMGLTVDLFNYHTGAFQAAAVGPMLLFTSGHVFAEVLTAIVLVRAYRQFPVTVPGAIAA